jgi:hypothetical protein
MRCTPRPCARRNLLQQRWVSLQRLSPIRSFVPLNLPPSSMDRRSGHVHRTPKDLPEAISLYSPMGRCAVQLVACSIHKSGDRSAMARSGCCMQRGSAIVARVRSVRSVKNQQRPSKRDGEVASIGLPLHRYRSQMSPLLSQENLYRHQFLIQCFGETGSVDSIGGR